jgi:hypothetical protein
MDSAAVLLRRATRVEKAARSANAAMTPRRDLVRQLEDHARATAISERVPLATPEVRLRLPA